MTDRLTSLPSFPQRGIDTASAFRTKADAAMRALPVMVEEINGLLPTIDAAATNAEIATAAANAAIAATTFVGTSAQSNTLTTGAGKDFATQAGRSFLPDDAITCIRRGDASARLRGTCAAYDSGSGALTVDVTSVPGDASAGAFTDWIVMHAAFEPPLTDEVIAAAIGAALVL
jgi:hypothetical protein